MRPNDFLAFALHDSAGRIVGLIYPSRPKDGKIPNKEAIETVEIFTSLAEVALENARLFEETKRLLEETQQRNQELAVINRVGQSLASQLDPQQIFEFVGETLGDVFMTQVIQIITYDRHTGLVNYRSRRKARE